MGTLDYQRSDDARREVMTGWRRKIFGISRSDAWAALAREINARLVTGGWWRGPKVVADFGPWQITLDILVESSGESSSDYTRLRAPFVNPTGFNFRIYRKSIFSGLGKMIGMQDIEIGEPHFDDAFIIQSNNPPKVIEMLRDNELRTLIQRQPRIMFQVRDDEGWFGPNFGPDVDELRFTALGVIRDIDRLKDLFELFTHTLHRLREIGCSSDRPPGLKL